MRLYVLQSYRSCTFCKHKTRGETQFLIELAAPCTLTNHNEINSDDTLLFIIFLTPVSCDGSNCLWRQRLLLSPCSLWRHKQTLIGVIRLPAGGKSRTFRQVIERYRFHRYLCFHCIYCVRVFCILFCMKRVTISYYNCIHSSSTLNLVNMIQIDWTVPCRTVKLRTHTSYDKRMTPFHFQCQGSKVKVTSYTLLSNLVNTIQTELFQLNEDHQTWYIYFFRQEDNTKCFTRSGVKGQGHTLNIVLKPCKHNTDWTVSARTIKLGTPISCDKRTAHIQGHWSKVKVTF